MRGGMACQLGGRWHIPSLNHGLLQHHKGSEVKNLDSRTVCAACVRSPKSRNKSNRSQTSDQVNAWCCRLSTGSPKFGILFFVPKTNVQADQCAIAHLANAPLCETQATGLNLRPHPLAWSLAMGIVQQGNVIYDQ